MARRALILAPLAALLIGGCSYAAPQKLTAQQETARKTFIKDHPNFTDHDLAKLCPALYPSNFLTDTKKYPLDKKDKSGTRPTPTQADRDQAAAAGCNIKQ
jgi:hypothetical protein